MDPTLTQLVMQIIQQAEALRAKDAEIAALHARLAEVQREPRPS